MNCTQCNASIPGDALTCSYCGKETPNFKPARELEAQNKRHAVQQAQVDAEKARKAQLAGLAGSARTAFYWSLAGVVVCCLPIGSLVGLLMGLKVRKTANELNVPVPGQALAAIILALGMMLFFTAALVAGIVSDHQKSVRVSALQAETKKGAAAAELDVATACGLAEIAMLEGGGGQTGGALSIFRCEGALEKQPEGKVVLKEIEYARSSSDTPKRVDCCFSKGSRWRVDAIGAGPQCGAGRDGGG